MLNWIKVEDVGVADCLEEFKLKEIVLVFISIL